jgi:hypothetical protein
VSGTTSAVTAPPASVSRHTGTAVAAIALIRW